MYLLRLRFRLVRKEAVETIVRRSKVGDWFLLYMLGENLDTVIYRDVMHELANKLASRHHHSVPGIKGELQEAWSKWVYSVFRFVDLSIFTRPFVRGTTRLPNPSLHFPLFFLSLALFLHAPFSINLDRIEIYFFRLFGRKSTDFHAYISHVTHKNA